MSFPVEFRLNGIDNFLYQLDQIMLRSSRQRNVCTLLVELGERLDDQTLKQHLAADPTYRWITSLRLKTGLPFALNRWQCDASPTQPKIKLIDNREGNRPPDDWVTAAIDPRKESPVKISLVQQPHKHSTLVVSWHHCLMDARGAEIFTQQLGSLQKSTQPLWIQNLTNDDQLTLVERLLHDREAKKNLYDISKPPLLSLAQRALNKPKLAHRVLRFSEKETLRITKTAEHHGAGFMLSTFYLAATAKTFATLLQRRNQNESDIFVPVPQDRRKRGANGPVIRNQVTFLFYRLPNAKLANLKSATAELVDQMKQLMRSDAPNQHLNMMERMHRVPGIAYRWLMKRPTKGVMASFFYSDTGDSLNGFKTFLGRSIVSALHFPPNTFPPGITFIYTRFQGRLQITCSYMQELITDAEMNAMERSLRTDLLGYDSVQVENPA